MFRGDIIRHEKVLEQNWRYTFIRTWATEQDADNQFVHLPNHCVLELKKLPFYQPKPSPNIPVKSSAIVGWRSSDPKYSMDLFKTRYRPEKIRFVREQYGYYRLDKYLKAARENEITEKSEPQEIPQKSVPYSIKRILC